MPEDSSVTVPSPFRGPVGPGIGRISLPKPLTSFIGRERELAQATQLLQCSYLVVLIRPDGHVAVRGRRSSLEPVAGYLRDLFTADARCPREASSSPAPW